VIDDAARLTRIFAGIADYARSAQAASRSRVSPYVRGRSPPQGTTLTRSLGSASCVFASSSPAWASELPTDIRATVVRAQKDQFR
jgi:hypothetical protein